MASNFVETQAQPELFLFMLLLGCKPSGRLTEQHDIFFGIASNLKELVPEINNFWPEANGKIHIDAWQKITSVDGHNISIVLKNSGQPKRLFFLNLGGYKPEEFDEYHYKMLAVAKSLSEATKIAKESTFFRHTGFKGAPAHIDDKYGIDIDDAFAVEDILSESMKKSYSISIEPGIGQDNEIHLGYLPLSKITTEG